MAKVHRKEQELAHYKFKILPLSKEDGGGFLAYFPDLPGCMSDGETVEEATVNGCDAFRDWIDVSKELGHKIPKPSFAFKEKDKVDRTLEVSNGFGASLYAKPDTIDSEEEKTRIVAEALDEWQSFRS